MSALSSLGDLDSVWFVFFLQISMQPVATVCSLATLEALAPLTSRFRLNASHMEPAAIVAFLSELEELMKKGLKSVRLCIDLQGSKMRLSRQQKEIVVNKGQKVTFVCEGEEEKDEEKEACIVLPSHILDRLLSVTGKDLKVGIEDGRIQLSVINMDKERRRLEAIVDVGGKVRPRKGLNVTPHPPSPTELSARDTEIVEKTKKFSFVDYALSFASSYEEIKDLRDKAGTDHIIAAKVELPLEQEILEAMLSVVDEYWLCRGDLGAQLGLRGMGEYYRRFTEFVKTHSRKEGKEGKCCGATTKPSFVLAGEVLEHMVASPIPTRSEVCHLLDAFANGYSSCILSNETAYGKYPKEAVTIVKEVTGYSE